MFWVLPPDAESIAPVVLFHSATGTLIAGDHVLNRQHHWLAEGRGATWRENLRVIQNRWDIKTVLPGHGPLGGPELIAKTDAYIARFLDLQMSGVTATEARKSMLHAYADYVFPEALEANIAANFTTD